MSVLQAIILGLVQGATEFIPISSSGHLILVPWLFNWHFLLDNPDLNKTFDVALHLGTFFAVLVYFWRDIGHLLAAFFRSLRRRRADSTDERLAWLLLISTIPAGLVGVAFENFIEDRLGKPVLIAALMIAFGLVMWYVDRHARLEREMSALTRGGALGIGVAQALALAPGVSRSGITMVTGMLLGLKREAAARYSFLLSVPVIGGAAFYKALKIAADGLPAGTAVPFVVGIASATASGFVAVWFMMAYLRRHSFAPFVIYRLAVGLGVLALIVAGVRSATGV
jgi:undecaprenyl-diphosphatase